MTRIEKLQETIIACTLKDNALVARQLAGEYGLNDAIMANMSEERQAAAAIRKLTTQDNANKYILDAWRVAFA